MPFDGTGIYSRVHRWQDDRDNGIRILADRHDEEDDSIAGALNQAFLRSGVVPMTGPIVMNGNNLSQIGAGSALQPGLTFELDFDTGFYQPGAGQLAVSINGAQKGLWTDEGLDVGGNLTVNGIEIGTGGATIGDNIEIPGHVKASMFQLNEPADVYFGAAAGNPILNFDANDFIVYDRVNDTMGFNAGGVSAFSINANGAYTPGRMQARYLLGNTPLPATATAPQKNAAYMAGDISLLGSADNQQPGINFNLYNNANTWTTYEAGFSSIFRHNKSNGDLEYWSGANVAAGASPPLGKVITIAQGGELYAKSYGLKDFGGFWLGGVGNIMTVNWDANDALQYDIANNVQHSIIAGISRFHVDNGGTVTVGQHTVHNGGGGGQLKILPGDAAHTGYVEFCNSAGTRMSYIGFQGYGFGNNLEYQNTNGGHHYFNAGIFTVGSINPGAVGNYYIGGDNNYTYFNFDGSDALQYYRLGNELNMIINGVTRTSERTNEQYYNTTTYAWTPNAFQMGTTTHAWYNVSSYQYATPSDAREKIWRGAATDGELRVANALIAELGFYKWNYGPAQDKLQFGFRAQNFAEILMREGLVERREFDFDNKLFIAEHDRPVFDYGMIEFVSWEENYLRGDGGEIVDTSPAGNRFGVNPDQINMFLIYALAKKLENVDERLKAFEAL